MRWLRRFWARLGIMFAPAGRERAGREFEEEIESHLAMHVEDNVRAGMTPAQARREAILKLGGIEMVRQARREGVIVVAMESLWQDLRFAVRQLIRSSGFTLVALLTLALGVGANTVVFSLINGFLLRPLPVPHADQLAVLRIEEGGPQPNYAFCTPFFRSLERRHDVFANVFAFDPHVFQVQGHSGNENFPGMLVSPERWNQIQN